MYRDIGRAYGEGIALGALAARIIRLGAWALPGRRRHGVMARHRPHRAYRRPGRAAVPPDAAGVRSGRVINTGRVGKGDVPCSRPTDGPYAQVRSGTG